VASAFSHAVAALGIGACFYRPAVPKRVWVAGALCAVIPDLDFLGFRFGIHYGDLFGHRGLTHSLSFAALLAGLVTMALARTSNIKLGAKALFAYLFLATASHGFLDAMTNGGMGVAFLSPFSNARYFLPWTPIQVSLIGISRFFTGDALKVLASEFIWIWIPAGVVAVFAWRLRKAPSQQAVA
jgi:inner membrane protein